MGIHSKILVHWTGKDIESSPKANKSQSYIERLKNDLQNGLFTKRTTEAAIRKLKIKNLVRICFTEIRLSQVQTHAGRFGKLGLGFTRDLIMNKGGRPVIYIPFEENADSLLENSVRTVYEKSVDNDQIHRSSKWTIAHVKRMSNGKGEDYYEEMEWRLVYNESTSNKHFTKDKDNGVYRLKFGPHDLKLIIFPDENTKRLALKDEDINKYFFEHMPIIATLEDCSNF